MADADASGAMDPFILVSLYEMTKPTFPPHPHAGFSVATYILPESPIGFVNQDSMGNKNRIAPGALHVTVAGSGVQHEEQPESGGATARGFQIWIDHAALDREVAPHAVHLRALDVPVVQREGATIRAIIGESNGVTSPVQIPTQVRIIDVALDAGASFTQELNLGENAFVFILEGIVEIGGVRVEAGWMATTAGDSNLLTVSAPAGSARLILFAGNPLRQKRIQRGPFIASNAEQLQKFITDFQAGGFGKLKPFADQPDWEINDG